MKTILEIIPMKEAVLCEDCHNITRAKGHKCLACGSTGIWNLGRVLDSLEVDVVVEKTLWASFPERKE